MAGAADNRVRVSSRLGTADGAPGFMARLAGGFVALVALGGLPAAAEAFDDRKPKWMPASEIRATFGGHTIEGHYADKRPFTERYDADGRLEYVEPYVRSYGRWSVRADSFCTIYDRDPTGGCYRVERQGANCYAFYFISRSEQQAEHEPLVRPMWAARGWRRDEPSTCEEHGMV